MPKKRAVIILGMHRSGTSAISRFVNMLGFDLGDHIMAARADNPKGFWENEEIVRHNDELMASAGLRWDALELDLSSVLKKGLTKKSLNVALRILRREFSADQIVIKDPRICRLYPIWQEILWSANFSITPVIVYRDPGSVARSLEKRDNMPLNRGLLLWLIYVLEAVQYAKRKPIIINYDELIQEPEKSLAPLQRLNPERFQEVRNQYIKNFLSKKLHHHKTRHAANHLEQLTQQVANYLCVEDHEPFRRELLPVLLATYLGRESSFGTKKLYDEISSAKAHSARLEVEQRSYNRNIKLLKTAVKEKDGYIASLKKGLKENKIVLKENEEYSESLRVSLEKKVVELSNAQKNLVKKNQVSDKYVASLSSAIEDKENYIMELSSSLSEKENQIAELSSSLSEKENYVNRLESIKLVGLAKRLYGFRKENDA